MQGDRALQEMDRRRGNLGARLHVQVQHVHRSNQAAPGDAAAGGWASDRSHPRRLLRQAQIKPPELSDDFAFLRRVYLDLIGVLPTPAERELLFLTRVSCVRPPSHSCLTRRTARMPITGSLSGTTCCATITPAPVYIDGGRKQITPWLYDTLLKNKPYDQFAANSSAPGRGGRVHQGHQMARQRQRQPGRRAAILAKRHAGFLRRQLEVRVVP